MPAEDDRQANHVVPRLELGHVWADGLDDSRRPRPRIAGVGELMVAVDEVQIAVADAARHRAAAWHFAPDRLRDVDVLDREGLLGTVKTAAFMDSSFL